MTPPDHRPSDKAEEPQPNPPSDGLERRFVELLRELEQLKIDVASELNRTRASESPVTVVNPIQATLPEAKRGKPPLPHADPEHEIRRLKRELLQRKAELTEIRTENARSLQRVEQENERLRQELAAAQRLLDGQLGADRRSSAFATDRPGAITEPPVASGSRSNRRDAETMRPGSAKSRESG